MVRQKEVIQIDVEINNKEIMGVIKELNQGFEDLRLASEDVTGSIRQVNHAMEDSGGVINGVITGFDSLGTVFDLLATDFQQISGNFDSLQSLASIATDSVRNSLILMDAGLLQSKVATTLLTTAFNIWTGATSFVSAAYKVLTGNIVAQTVATYAQAAATAVLNAVMLAGPFLLVAAAVAGGVAIFNRFRNSTDEVRQETDRLNNEIDLLSDTMEQNKQASKENARVFEQNMRAIDANSSSVQNQMEHLKELAGQEELSAAEKVKMNHLIEQLNGSVDGLNLAYDEEAGLIMSTSVAMEESNDIMEDSVLLTEDAIKAMEDKVNAYFDINDEISKMQLAQEQMNQLSEEEIQIARDLEEVVALQNQLTEAREEGLIGTRAYRNGMEELEEKLDDVKNRQEENTEAQMKAAEIIAESQEKIAQATEESSTRQKVAFESLSEAQQSVIETLQREFNDYVDTLRDGNHKIDTSNSLSAENWKETMLHNQETMSAWADNVDLLTDRVSDEMLEYVKSLGPEHAGLVEDMVNMSNDELKDLESVFGDNIEVAERAALSGIASSRIPEETHHLVSDTGETMAQSIEKANFKDLGLKIPDGLSTGIEEGQDDVNKATADTIDGAAEACEEAAEIRSPSKVFIRIANNLMKGLLKGIQDDRPKVTKELDKLKPDFDKAGRDAMDGLNAGLNARRSTVLNTARSIANEVTRTIRNALDINSPSRVMRDQVGKFIPEGIAVGINAESDTVMDAMQSISDDMIKIPKISPESLVESSRGGLFIPSSSTQSPITNNHHTHNEGLFNGATIIWKGKEDIRQTMQEIAWITQTEGARM